MREVAVTDNPWSKALRWKHWRFVHYQSEMFDGQDMGELYDLATDPDETANLYHEPQYQETVNHCRRLLLEWLIRTTRVVTVWPPVACPDITDSHSYDYATVGDGKESNQAGPAQRKAIGQICYL